MPGSRALRNLAFGHKKPHNSLWFSESGAKKGGATLDAACLERQVEPVTQINCTADLAVAQYNYIYTTTRTMPHGISESWQPGPQSVISASLLQEISDQRVSYHLADTVSLAVLSFT